MNDHYAERNKMFTQLKLKLAMLLWTKLRETNLNNTMYVVFGSEQLFETADRF